MNGFVALADGVTTRAVQVGERWVVERPKLSFEATCISSNPDGEGPVYAGTRDGRILASHDIGKTWLEVGSVGKEVRSIAIAPSNPATLYAGTKPSHIFVSEDSGKDWVELVQFRKIPWRWLWHSPAEFPLSAYVQSMAVSPQNPEVILAGIEAGAVVRSDDGGLTWQGHRQGSVRDCHNLVFHSRDGNWAYEAGGSGNGAAFSKDGGVTWAQPRSGLDRHYCWAVAADRTEPGRWYVSASPGPRKAHGSGNAQAYVYRMDKNGIWERLGGSLPQPLNHMPYALLTSPYGALDVYAGLKNGEVWHSSDRGDTWGQLPLSLGSIERSLIIA